MSKNKKMTKKSYYGTLSTKGCSDKKCRQEKEVAIASKMKALLGLNQIRFTAHANKRMGERSVIDYEVRQALHNGKHNAKRDRFSNEFNQWEYSIEGQTIDKRDLRIGISFETTATGEKLLIITVIDPNN